MLMVRSDNAAVTAFYTALGYEAQAVTTFWGVASTDGEIKSENRQRAVTYGQSVIICSLPVRAAFPKCRSGDGRSPRIATRRSPVPIPSRLSIVTRSVL
jgi:hypothetical protein